MSLKYGGFIGFDRCAGEKHPFVSEILAGLV
jgi:hypothetical protein